MSRRSWVAFTRSPLVAVLPARALGDAEMPGGIRPAAPASTAAALADLAGINDYFTIGTGPVVGDRIPLHQLYTDSDLLDGVVARVKTRIGATERRVAASTFFLGFAARLWSIGIGAVIGHRLLPDLGSHELSFSDAAGHPTLHIAHPLGWQGDDLESKLADVVLDGHLAPLSDTLQRVGPIAPKLLRGNAASALLGAANIYDRHRGSGLARRLAERLCTDQRLAGAIEFGAESYRRTSCCLYYRTRTSGVCGDCVFTRVPAPVVRKDAP